MFHELQVLCIYFDNKTNKAIDPAGDLSSTQEQSCSQPYTWRLNLSNRVMRTADREIFLSFFVILTVTLPLSEPSPTGSRSVK